MSFLAPQAYTKETLAKAFDWLQHQPSHVAQAATTPDNLVALYLKAQRNGIGSAATVPASTATMSPSPAARPEHDAPVSSKRFIDDLKNLRKDLASFEEEAPENSAPGELVPEYTTARGTSGGGGHFGRDRDNNITVNVAVANVDNSNKGNTVQLDEKSMEAVNDVQARFNLSSPQEAVRLLITVGRKHVSQWP